MDDLQPDRTFLVCSGDERYPHVETVRLPVGRRLIDEVASTHPPVLFNVLAAA